MTSPDLGGEAVLMPSNLDQAAAGLLGEDEAQSLNTAFMLAKTALNATHMSNAVIEQQLGFIIIVIHCVARLYVPHMEIRNSHLAAISLDHLLALNDVPVLPMGRFKE